MGRHFTLVSMLDHGTIVKTQYPGPEGSNRKARTHMPCEWKQERQRHI